MQLNILLNAAWQWSFILVHIVLWSTCTTFLTNILLVSFASNLVLVFWLNSNSQDDITFIGRQSMWFAVKIISMAHPTHAHAQTNCHVLQFGHWNQLMANTYHNRYMNFVSKRYIAETSNLPIYLFHNAGAVILSSFESDSYLEISFGHYVQGYKLAG